ncbi:hypothetical protein CXB51_035812 [Gossypium anomalum]|uniref:Uncharacterized protein n=1 Tax=Gossypium anomalum TaxID=47600 RepID=A0A8J6CKI5_9ROSI|nr:hypothetical protein CXB51_035812 [Gossypium anomalum]
MEVEVDEEELKSAGAEFLFSMDGRSSLLFGSLKDIASGNDIRFNALDAFSGWKHEGLPPVKVPFAAQWKFRRILDYDCGSDMVELDSDKNPRKKFQRGAQASIGRIAHCGLMSLRSHEKNQFFSVMREVFMFVTQVVLYEDELADNKVSLLTVKVCYLDCGTPASIVFLMGVHILPFFEKDVGRKAHINLYLLLAFCLSRNSSKICTLNLIWIYNELKQKGYPTDSAAYGDPSISSQRLPVIMYLTQKLLFPGNLPLPVQTICTEQTHQNLDLEIVGPQLYQLDLKFRESDNVDEWGYYRKRIS